MMRFILYAIGFFLLFRLIFNFILPLISTTRQVRRQFKDMQERMNAHVRNGQTAEPPRPAQPADKIKKEDYLDFEEVKP